MRWRSFQCSSVLFLFVRNVHVGFLDEKIRGEDLVQCKAPINKVIEEQEEEECGG